MNVLSAFATYLKENTTMLIVIAAAVLLSIGLFALAKWLPCDRWFRTLGVKLHLIKEHPSENTEATEIAKASVQTENTAAPAESVTSAQPENTAAPAEDLTAPEEKNAPSASAERKQDEQG